ncbi:MAG: hypothetical protein FWE31_00130 [Firmicutes bacterium]|nr:hypothetical protein [Bacillota bacterium]
MEYIGVKNIRAQDKCIWVISDDGKSVFFDKDNKVTSHDSLTKQNRLEGVVVRGFIFDGVSHFLSKLDVEYDLVKLAEQVSADLLKLTPYRGLEVYVRTPSIKETFHVGEVEIEKGL